jgi:hypothetical protein
VLTCYARPHRGRSLLVVIALRPEDERGWEILNELPQRIEMQSVEETPAGSRRYHLVGEHLDLDSLDPELDRIRPERAQSHQGLPRVRFLTQPD